MCSSDLVGRDLEGEAPLPEVDAVDLPAADDLLLQSGGVAAHALAFAERQVPDEARDHAVVHVEIREPVVAGRIVVVQEPLPAGQVLPDAGGGEITRWFNTAAFAQPPLGSYGNSGRNRAIRSGEIGRASCRERV